MIKNCSSCKGSHWQDTRYGAGNRLMNQTTKGFRCTVCGKDYIPPAQKKKES